MTTVDEYSIDLEGVRSRAIELHGAGPPVLLLHGFSDSADTWRPVIEHLRRGGRRALAIDLPGFGRADHVDPRAPVLPQLDRAVTAALQRFPAGSRPIVAGNSLGGLAALRAAQDPELGIGAVVPIAPAGLTFARWLQIIESTLHMHGLMWHGLLSAPVPFPQPVFRHLVGQVYRNLVFSTPSAADPGVVARYARNVGERADLARMIGMARRALPELADPFDLTRISCEVVVVWGTEDRLVSPVGARTISAHLPHARIKILEGCGHCPQVELPALTARLLEDVAVQVAKARPRGGPTRSGDSAARRETPKKGSRR